MERRRGAEPIVPTSNLPKHSLRLRGGRFQFLRWDTVAVAVPVEEDALGFTHAAFRRLDPLAPSGALPYAFEESNRSTLHIGTIVCTHHLLDGLRGLVCVIKGDG